MGGLTQDGCGDFGAALRTAREAKGVSLAEIAESTKISTSVLAALERNDVSDLPGGIFWRSFVRSYAQAVGLDPEATVQAFLESFPSPDMVVGSVYTKRSDDDIQFASQRLITRIAVGLFVLSLPLAVLLVLLGLGDSADSDLLTPEGFIELGPPRAAGSWGFRESGEEATRPLVIDIHPREACWVSLTLDGARVVSRVMEPGEREVHEALQEIVLSVGNAGVFSFSINQQPGQSLGADHEVVTAHIDRDNYRRFLVQPEGPASDAAGH